MLHKLKCWNPFFTDVYIGEKTFEIRKNDRDFLLGDELLLQEWNHIANIYTGREVTVTVVYMTQWEQKDGWVVMGIKAPTVEQVNVTSRSILSWGLDRMTARAESLLLKNQRLELENQILSDKVDLYEKALAQQNVTTEAPYRPEAEERHPPDE